LRIYFLIGIVILTTTYFVCIDDQNLCQNCQMCVWNFPLTWHPVAI